MSYCIVIQRELEGTKCPIPEAECVWKHRQTGHCKFDPEAVPSTVEELAVLVGAEIPTPEEVENLKQAIKTAVIKELS